MEEENVPIGHERIYVLHLPDFLLKRQKSSPCKSMICTVHNKFDHNKYSLLHAMRKKFLETHFFLSYLYINVVIGQKNEATESDEM